MILKIFHPSQNESIVATTPDVLQGVDCCTLDETNFLDRNCPTIRLKDPFTVALFGQETTGTVAPVFLNPQASRMLVPRRSACYCHRERQAEKIGFSDDWLRRLNFHLDNRKQAHLMEAVVPKHASHCAKARE